jgi:hypothetical protein
MNNELYNDHLNFIKKINYGYSLINKKNYDELDKYGFTIIECDKNYWTKNDVDFDELEKKSDELVNNKGFDAEEGTKRASNLVEEDSIFIKIAKLPDFLKAADYVIKHPFKLNAVQLRYPQPYAKRQDLHIDWRPRLRSFYNFNQITCFVYFDDTNQENGAMHVYPGTHNLLGEPTEKRIRDLNLSLKILNAKKFNIAITNIYAWHYGGQNINGKPRRTIFSSYRERSEFQQLNQKKYLSPKTISGFTDFEKYLFAVRDSDIEQNDYLKSLINKNFLIRRLFLLRDYFYHKKLNLHKFKR